MLILLLEEKTVEIELCSIRVKMSGTLLNRVPEEIQQLVRVLLLTIMVHEEQENQNHGMIILLESLQS